MSQIEKDLLLKDLCARLPYGVKVKFKNIIQPQRLHWSFVSDEKDWDLPKPYLRPMSSMTEEEKDEYESFIFTVKKDIQNCIFHTCEMVEVEETNNMIDWLNEHHFDHRGLIEKGLALEAPEDMYKINYCLKN